MTANKKQLLIESCEFVSKIKIPKKLKESLELSKGKSGTLIVRNIPCTICNRRNLNGRIYSTQIIQAAIDEAKPLIESKQLLSQACEHPEGSFVSPTTASHVIIGAYVKPNVELMVEGKKERQDVLFMDWEVLNTQEGQNLRALLEAECSVGVSIRGVGDLDGDRVIEYSIYGCDAVGQPSSGTYTRMPVSESVRVELEDREPMKEGFVVTTSSTNVVGDLEKAAVIQANLDNATYGTVVKTHTTLDSEVDPKTGATTEITTLEAETEDEVGTLDQALQMAKNAILNPTVNVDSVTIENVKDEDEVGGKKEAAPEYVPEDGIEMQEETPITEAKEKDPKEGKQFVLKVPNGYVSMEGNALMFKDDPKKALHFIVGKENTGLVHLSEVEKILDTMGVYDVQKYYKRDLGDISATAEEKQEGLNNGDVSANTMGSNTGISADQINEKTVNDVDPVAVNGAQNAMLTEENPSNTRYVATVKSEGEGNTTDAETVPVSARDGAGMVAEVGNLWKQKSKNGSQNLVVTVKDTVNGDEFTYNPASNVLEPTNLNVISADAGTDYADVTNPMVNEALGSDDAGIEQDDNKLTMTVNPDDDEPVEVEKEFDSKAQADVAKAGLEKGEIDGSVMLNEDTIEPGWYVGIEGVGVVGPYATEEEARQGLEGYEDQVSVQYLGENAELEEAGAGAAVGAGLGTLLGGPVGTLAGGALGSMAQDYFSKKDRKPGWKSGALLGGMVGGVPGALIGGGLQHMLTGDRGTVGNMGKAIKNGAAAFGRGIKNGYNKMVGNDKPQDQAATQNTQAQPQQAAVQQAQTQEPQAQQAPAQQPEQAQVQAQQQAAQAKKAAEVQIPVIQQVQDVQQQVHQSLTHLQQLDLQMQQLATELQNAQANVDTPIWQGKITRGKDGKFKSLRQEGVEEAANMDEVLFTGEQPASDPVVEQPLQDAVQDLTVTLTDVDWDIDSIIAKASEPDMSKDDLFALIQNLPNQVTVSLRDVEISDNPMMIKQAILKAANEQTPYQINNATIATVQ